MDPISFRPAYMDEYEKLEEELKKVYEVITYSGDFEFQLNILPSVFGIMFCQISLLYKQSISGHYDN